MAFGCPNGFKAMGIGEFSSFKEELVFVGDALFALVAGEVEEAEADGLGADAGRGTAIIEMCLSCNRPEFRGGRTRLERCQFTDPTIRSLAGDGTFRSASK